jgi:serine/threonine-protein kinase
MTPTDPSAGTGHPDEEVLAGTPYRFIRRLGQGGMADVFLVEHEGIRRAAVIKLLHQALADNPKALESARVEAHALAALDEPNIVQVLDFRQTARGRPFLVLEYLEGRTLREEINARGELPLSEALLLVRQALAAFIAVHRLGIVHRDIKPENLFVCTSAGKPLLKVLDFGVARIIPGVSPEAPAPPAILTETGTVIGTLRYLSPEAALGRRVDARADLYQIALVAYELVAGRGPFEEHSSDYVHAHTIEEPPPPSRFARQPIPTELDRVIMRALAKNPHERFGTAEEFAEEIDHIRALLENSQALETTLYSASRSDAEPALEPAPPAQTEASNPNVSLARERKRRKGERFGSVLASVVVALVTAVALTTLIAVVIARFPR